MNMARFPLSATPDELNAAGAAAARVGDEYEAPLLQYASLRDAATLPYLSAPEQRRQGLAGIRHAMALDPARRAPFISIHYRLFQPDRPDPIFPGHAHTSLDSAVKSALYWANKGHCVYWSMGAQKTAGEHKPGMPYPRANRLGPNIALLRCLYVDIDVKPDKPKDAYASTHEAALALVDFVQALGLVPTMIVGSGTGGLHVYWQLERALTPDEFAPAAEALRGAGTKYGLRFDKQCTSDRTRLLRVPGTWNFKGAEIEGVEAKPVTLVYLNERS